MRTKRQIEASRRNGARSRGPSTPEGKIRSGANAISHGLSSKVVVLANESRDGYNQLLDSYLRHWSPANQPELDLVHDIVAARWHLNRTLSLESATLDLEIDRERPQVDTSYERIDQPTRCALAFSALADNGRTLATLGRHESRLRRVIERATAELRRLKAERGSSEQTAPPPAPAVQTENFTNEPSGKQSVDPQYDAAVPALLNQSRPPAQPVQCRAEPETSQKPGSRSGLNTREQLGDRPESSQNRPGVVPEAA